jgi:hypothetical protein
LDRSDNISGIAEALYSGSKIYGPSGGPNALGLFKPDPIPFPMNASLPEDV